MSRRGTVSRGLTAQDRATCSHPPLKGTLAGCGGNARLRIHGRPRLPLRHQVSQMQPPSLRGAGRGIRRKDALLYRMPGGWQDEEIAENGTTPDWRVCQPRVCRGLSAQDQGGEQIAPPPDQNTTRVRQATQNDLCRPQNSRPALWQTGLMTVGGAGQQATKSITAVNLRAARHSVSRCRRIVGAPTR